MMELPASDTCIVVRDEASALLTGDLPTEEWGQAIAHIADCEGCATFLAEIIPTLIALRQLACDEPTYEATARGLLAFLESQAPKAEPVPSKSPGHPARVPRRQVRSGQYAQTLRQNYVHPVERLCYALCESAWSLIPNIDPVRALRMAGAAAQLCENVGSLRGKADLELRCHHALAAASLSASDLEGATASIEKALSLYEDGEQAPELRARLLLTTGAIQCASGVPSRAKESLTEAGTIFERLGLTQDGVKVRVSLGSTMLTMGCIEPAIAILREAWDLSNEDTPAYVRFNLVLNLAIGYCEEGRVEEAEALQPELSRLVIEIGGDAPVHSLWLEGTISRVKGNWETALEAFFKVRAFFERCENAIHFVESTLDICRVYVACGEWLKLKSLVQETAVGVLDFCGQRSILNTVALLQMGVEERTLDQAQLGVLVGLLARRGGRTIQQ